jgi:hypothetical protein
MGTMAPERAILSMYGVEKKEMGIVDQEEGKEERSERRSGKGQFSVDCSKRKGPGCGSQALTEP